MYANLQEKEKFFTCKTVNSVSELTEIINSLKGKNIVFRGVKDAKFMCYSSAQVNAILRGVTLNQDQLDGAMIDMISAVRKDKKIMSISRRMTNDETDVQILGLLQHYTFGTTILDFTYCFSDAVFFATDGANYSNCGDINDYLSIYYLDIDDPDHHTFQDINVSYIPEVARFDNELKSRYGALYTGVSEQTQNSFGRLPYEELCTLDGGLTIGGGTKYRTKVYDKTTGIKVDYYLASERLSAQDGLFKLHPRADISYEEAALAFYSGMNKKLFCLNIHKSLIPELKKVYLEPYGITSSVIYPNSKQSIKLTKLLLKSPIDPIFRPRTKPQCLNHRTWMKYERIYQKRYKKLHK